MKHPPFDPFPELSSERVLLRELTANYLDFVFGIMRYDGKPAESIEDAVAMIAKIDGDYRNGATVNWLILDAQTSRPVGTIGYYRGFAQETGEIGFILNETAQGKGYMTEALRLVVRFGLETMRLKRVIAITKLSNEPAVRLLKRCGFRLNGPFSDIYDEFEYHGAAARP